MALYDMLLWSVGDITTTGPDPFALSSDANGSSPGNSTITFNAGASIYSVDDSDPNFGDGDNSQSSGGQMTDPEYSYVIRPQGSSNPADNIIIYKTDLNGSFTGIVADGFISPGVTYDVISIDTSTPNPAYTTIFICFAAGTGIATPRGAVPVEALTVGDLVLTGDHGAQPIRWIGRRQVAFEHDNARGRPIEFKPGSLGPGLPNRRLVVSPQHRMLTQHPEFPDGVLVPAVAMTDLPGVRRMKGCRSVEYIHLCFDRHEIIFAEDCPAESFLLAEQGLDLLSIWDLRQLIHGLGNGAHEMAPARQILKAGAARSLFKSNTGQWHVPDSQERTTRKCLA